MLSLEQQPLERKTSRGGAPSSAPARRAFSARAAPAGGPFTPFWTSVGIFGLVNLVGFGVSVATGSHLHLDLLGTGAFTLVALATIGPDLRSKLSAAFVGIWAARLAAFLCYRAWKLGHDARLDDTLSTIVGMAGFWVASFLWGVVAALPHTLGAGCVSPAPGLGWLAMVGVVVSAWGLCWEVVADVQKWNFKADPANSGRPCTVGLWSVSQHPNYFGNLCLWSGIFLINSVPLFKAGAYRLVLAALCPVFLWLLFHSQATGSLTNANELASKKYGGDPNYAEYLRTVPLIIPWFPTAAM